MLRLWCCCYVVATDQARFLNKKATFNRRFKSQERSLARLFQISSMLTVRPDRTVVVAQLLPTQEIRGSNPVNGNLIEPIFPVNC